MDTGVDDVHRSMKVFFFFFISNKCD